MRTLFLHIALLFGLPLLAQETGPVLTRRALLQLVADNHPAVRQAQLRNAMGDAVVRSARGAFDPVAVASYSEKQFDGKEYYGLLDAGLRIPTWFGAELVGGFGTSQGFYLDPQNTLPDEGQLSIGARVQLGQGLFIDRRRAEFRKAQAYQDMAEAERQRMLNQIFLAVLSDHVDWVANYRELTVALQALDQAVVRFNAVTGNYRGGDVPAIDTLEALLQVQDRQMRLQDAELGFRVAAIQLSNHLWDEFLRPLELDPNVLPDTLDLAPPDAPVVLDSLFADATRRHPDLLEREGRLKQLEIERRFRAEMIKPRLDLNAALLSTGGLISGEGQRDPSWRADDRQLGLTFSMPLLLRRERGDLSLAGLGLSDAELGLDRQRAVIRNMIDKRFNELSTLQLKVSLGNEMVQNYQFLLDGENTRFMAGESSLFLVNQREVALLASQLKQVDLLAERRKAFFSLDHDAGVLWRVVAGELGSNP